MEPDNRTLDLSYLTEEEREHLLAVIRADDRLRTGRMGLVKRDAASKLYWTPEGGQKFPGHYNLSVMLENDHISASELLWKSLTSAEDGSLKDQVTPSKPSHTYKGNCNITGDVLVGVYYKDGELHIHVDRARGLAAADINGYSDPYIKTYLLPDKDKHTKWKTSIKKKTLNPVYDETIKYRLSESELRSQTLLLNVWDWDRIGRNQFLGEIHLPLSSLNLSDTSDHWHTLHDKTPNPLNKSYKGQIKISMMFNPDVLTKGKGTLCVAVEQAKDLPEVSEIDSIVTLLLLPDSSTGGKRETNVSKSSSRPTWAEKFSYGNVGLSELKQERVLEVTVWNIHESVGSVFIGGLHLGPAPGSSAKHKDWMDSTGDEVTHWEDMLAHPWEWVEQWHNLRATMKPTPRDQQNFFLV